jgi:hypothetical protein
MQSREQTIKDALDNFKAIVESQLSTCIRCTRFNEQQETCGYNGMRPPARIIAFGCEKFENKEVPF